jgi:hypothetical protein
MHARFLRGGHTVCTSHVAAVLARRRKKPRSMAEPRTGRTNWPDNL